jgi:hypothetical protein
MMMMESGECIVTYLEENTTFQLGGSISNLGDLIKYYSNKYPNDNFANASIYWHTKTINTGTYKKKSVIFMEDEIKDGDLIYIHILPSFIQRTATIQVKAFISDEGKVDNALNFIFSLGENLIDVFEKIYTFLSLKIIDTTFLCLDGAIIRTEKNETYINKISKYFEDKNLISNMKITLIFKRMSEIELSSNMILNSDKFNNMYVLIFYINLDSINAPHSLDIICREKVRPLEVKLSKSA